MLKYVKSMLAGNVYSLFYVINWSFFYYQLQRQIIRIKKCCLIICDISWPSRKKWNNKWNSQKDKASCISHFSQLFCH